MKAMHYYSTVGVNYPGRDQYTKVFVYRAGTVLVDGILQSVMPPDDLKLHKQKGDTIEYVFDQEAFNAALLIYTNKEHQLYLEFKGDLFDAHDVLNNPKRDLLFDKAWALGHASGFSEVKSYFEELVDLIK